ncbi:MAG: GAF domain-containing protein [Anaerolineales bacterium]|nr:GAF domain-containing protein [Chloroflexota bacterium]MBL6982147.1 GAF domain-containing protein [Anaerolineales bacterium]
MQSNEQIIRTLRTANASLKQESQALEAENNRLRNVIHALNTLQYNLDAITPETKVMGLVSKILYAALEAVDSENGSLLLLSPRDNQLVFVEVIGQSRAELLGYRMPANQGIAGWVLANKSPILIPDVHKDQRWYSHVDETTGFQTASILGVPLFADERPLGIIEVVNTRGGKPFHEGDLDIMILVGRLASLALVRAEETTTD